MTHVFFNPDSVNWSPLFTSLQEGRGEQQYFVGTRYQRGGGLLQNVARFLMPVASNLLSTVSKEGIAAGTRVLGDLSQGKALNESLKTHAKHGLDNLAEKLQQCGKGGSSGKKRRPARSKKAFTSFDENAVVGSTASTKRRSRKIVDQLSFP